MRRQKYDTRFVNYVQGRFVTGFEFDSNEMGLVRRTGKNETNLYT